ncbi:MAG: nucleoside monophosphate kinase [Planctomycetota bacterium]
MTATLRSLLIIGPPGVGKGTQGKVLGAIPGLVHHSSGDVFRSLDKVSDLGRTFLSYSTKGELVPDGLTIEIWRSDADRRIETGEFDPATDLLILDGIPRNPTQAALMDEHVDVLGIILLVAKNEQELIDRLRKRAEKEDRPDDADETVIRRRLEVYEDATRPLLGHYDTALIHEVDALGTPAEVARRVLDVVIPVQASLATA